MINLQKKAKPSFEDLQKWYDAANWSGEVSTPFGKLTAYSILFMREEHYPNRKLEYNCPA